MEEPIFKTSRKEIQLCLDSLELLKKEKKRFHEGLFIHTKTRTALTLHILNLVIKKVAESQNIYFIKKLFHLKA